VTILDRRGVDAGEEVKTLDLSAQQSQQLGGSFCTSIRFSGHLRFGVASCANEVKGL
jgi:hypothetical protein